MAEKSEEGKIMKRKKWHNLAKTWKYGGKERGTKGVPPKLHAPLEKCVRMRACM